MSFSSLFLYIPWTNSSGCMCVLPLPKLLFLCILTHCVCVVVVKCLMPNLLVFRATDFIYLLCNIGSKQGSKGGSVYTDLSGGTKRFPLFCLALLLAAIWLIMAAIFFPLKIFAILTPRKVGKLLKFF